MTTVIEATLPITTIALEVLVFRTQALQWRTACGVATGFLGVVLLLFHAISRRWCWNRLNADLADMVGAVVFFATAIRSDYICWEFGRHRGRGG
jgi:drug/metabolite transporter (DMT)-like permease